MNAFTNILFLNCSKQNQTLIKDIISSNCKSIWIQSESSRENFIENLLVKTNLYNNIFDLIDKNNHLNPQNQINLIVNLDSESLDISDLLLIQGLSNFPQILEYDSKSQQIYHISPTQIYQNNVHKINSEIRDVWIISNNIEKFVNLGIEVIDLLKVYQIKRPGFSSTRMRELQMSKKIEDLVTEVVKMSQQDSMTNRCFANFASSCKLILDVVNLSNTQNSLITVLDKTHLSGAQLGANASNDLIKNLNFDELFVVQKMFTHLMNQSLYREPLIWAVDRDNNTKNINFLLYFDKIVDDLTVFPEKCSSYKNQNPSDLKIVSSTIAKITDLFTLEDNEWVNSTLETADKTFILEYFPKFLSFQMSNSKSYATFDHGGDFFHILYGYFGILKNGNKKLQKSQATEFLRSLIGKNTWKNIALNDLSEDQFVESFKKIILKYLFDDTFNLFYQTLDLEADLEKKNLSEWQSYIKTHLELPQVRDRQLVILLISFLNFLREQLGYVIPKAIFLEKGKHPNQDSNEPLVCGPLWFSEYEGEPISSDEIELHMYYCPPQENSIQNSIDQVTKPVIDITPELQDRIREINSILNNLTSQFPDQSYKDFVTLVNQDYAEPISIRNYFNLSKVQEIISSRGKTTVTPKNGWRTLTNILNAVFEMLTYEEEKAKKTPDLQRNYAFKIELMTHFLLLYNHRDLKLYLSYYLEQYNKLYPIDTDISLLVNVENYPENEDIKSSDLFRLEQKRIKSYQKKIPVVRKDKRFFPNLFKNKKKEKDPDQSVSMERSISPPRYVPSTNRQKNIYTPETSTPDDEPFNLSPTQTPIIDKSPVTNATEKSDDESFNLSPTQTLTQHKDVESPTEKEQNGDELLQSGGKFFPKISDKIDTQKFYNNYIAPYYPIWNLYSRDFPFIEVDNFLKLFLNRSGIKKNLARLILNTITYSEISDQPGFQSAIVRLTNYTGHFSEFQGDETVVVKELDRFIDNLDSLIINALTKQNDLPSGKKPPQSLEYIQNFFHIKPLKIMLVMLLSINNNYIESIPGTSPLNFYGIVIPPDTIVNIDNSHRDITLKKSPVWIEEDVYEDLFKIIRHNIDVFSKYFATKYEILEFHDSHHEKIWKDSYQKWIIPRLISNQVSSPVDHDLKRLITNIQGYFSLFNRIEASGETRSEITDVVHGFEQFYLIDKIDRYLTRFDGKDPHELMYLILVVKSEKVDTSKLVKNIKNVVKNTEVVDKIKISYSNFYDTISDDGKIHPNVLQIVKNSLTSTSLQNLLRSTPNLKQKIDRVVTNNPYINNFVWIINDPGNKKTALKLLKDQFNSVSNTLTEIQTGGASPGSNFDLANTISKENRLRTLGINDETYNSLRNITLLSNKNIRTLASEISKINDNFIEAGNYPKNNVNIRKMWNSGKQIDYLNLPHLTNIKKNLNSFTSENQPFQPGKDYLRPPRLSSPRGVQPTLENKLSTHIANNSKSNRPSLMSVGLHSPRISISPPLTGLKRLFTPTRVGGNSEYILQYIDEYNNWILELRQKQGRWIGEMENFIKHSHDIIEKEAGKISDKSTTNKSTYKNKISVVYKRIYQAIDDKIQLNKTDVKEYYINGPVKLIQDWIAGQEKYQGKGGPLPPTLPAEIPDKNFPLVVAEFTKSQREVSEMNHNFMGKMNELMQGVKSGGFDLLDSDRQLMVKSQRDYTEKDMNYQSEKIKSFVNLNYSTFDMILDTKFATIYIIKLIRLLFIYIALFLTTRIFTPIYDEVVYDQKKNPPSLTQYLFIWLALDLSLNAFLLVILFLLKFLFKTPNNAFPIDNNIFTNYAVDYAVATVIILAISYLIGRVIMEKRYFDYRYAGQRAVRSFESIVFNIALVTNLIPFFVIK